MNDRTTLWSASPLGRPIDFSFSSNVLAVATSLTVAIGFLTYDLVAGPLRTPSWASGVAVFVAWAIGRELDPDHNGSAALAMVAAVGFAALWEPSLLTGAGLLVAVRLSSGTVGLPRRAVDDAALIAIGAVLGLSGGGLAALPALAAAIVVDGGWHRYPLLTALAATAAGAGAFMTRRPDLEYVGPGIITLIILAMAMLALVTTLPARPVRSSADFGDRQIDTRRVTVSRVLAGTTVVTALGLGGHTGVTAVAATVVAAIVGVAVRQVAPDRRNAGLIGVGERID